MIDHAIAGLQAGDPVVLPFDTVYGLAADPFRKEPTRRLYELKGRDQTEPSALVARDLDQLLECLPVLDGGELPGSPSTVIDLSGAKPRILRDGALPAEEALRRLGAAVRSG